MDADKPTPGVPVAAGMPHPGVAIHHLYDIPTAEQQRNFQLSLQRVRTEPALMLKRPSAPKKTKRQTAPKKTNLTRNKQNLPLAGTKQKEKRSPEEEAFCKYHLVLCMTMPVYVNVFGHVERR